MKVVNRGDGDVISCTSGGSERYGGGYMNYNPGSIPTALAQSGFWRWLIINIEYYYLYRNKYFINKFNFKK